MLFILILNLHCVYWDTVFFIRLSDVMLTFYLAALFLRLLKTVVGDHSGELTIASEQLHANVLFQGWLWFLESTTNVCQLLVLQRVEELTHLQPLNLPRRWTAETHAEVTVWGGRELLDQPKFYVGWAKNGRFTIAEIDGCSCLTFHIVAKQEIFGVLLLSHISFLNFLFYSFSMC